MPHEGTHHPAIVRRRRSLPFGLASVAGLVAGGVLSFVVSAPAQAHETGAGTDSTGTVHLHYAAGRAAEVIGYAASFAGTPYEWGGTTPAGFDCSGFTDYVFAHFGIHLPRTAAEQARAVPRVSSPQPGDLVFFTDDPTGVVHHVAIYAGDGYVWHAPHTGASVRLERIWTSQVFYGRVLSATPAADRASKHRKSEPKKHPAPHAAKHHKKHAAKKHKATDHHGHHAHHHHHRDHGHQAKPRQRH